VNTTKIKSKTWTELKFGDFLFLGENFKVEDGEMVDCFNKQVEDKPFFLFQVSIWVMKYLKDFCFYKKINHFLGQTNKTRCLHFIR
jgi:hypothetical protein